MSMKKWSAGVMAAAIAFSLAVPAGAATTDPESLQPLAYYDGTQDSPHKTVYAGDYTYDCYATLYYRSSSKACLWLVENGSQDGPASLRACLYENGELIGNSGWDNSNSYIHFVNTRNYSVSGSLAADGEYKAYHDQSKSDYTSGWSRQAEHYYSGRSATKEAVSSYPVNQNGETYGSYLDRHTVGYAPDLISARGENGVRGYIRLEDFAPEMKSLAEVQVWQASVDADNMIPLYDLNGNVIGEYALGTTQEQEEIDPAILADIYDAFHPQEKRFTGYLRS